MTIIRRMRPLTYFLAAMMVMLEGTPLLAAEKNAATASTLPEVVVTARKEPGKTLPEVEGTKIYSGKKASVIDLEEAPAIVNNNFRQILQKSPGLLLSEESTPLLSIGYRGLDPHRAQFTQVLKDGVPIHADMFGYPEAYYVPPAELVDRIDFVRGGASLMYGPQPGGALNFVTQDPAGEPFSFSTSNSIGSHDFYSNYTSVSGTPGPLSYYGYFHHRQSQGFRESNSQYDLYYGGSKFVIEQDPTAKWTISFDLYNEEHGEPGGLTRADFDTNPSFSTRLTDHFELNRYAGSLFYDKEIDEAARLELKSYAIYYERLSWRQRGGGFGTIPAGANASTNDIESQEFYTAGIDARWKRDWTGFGSEENTFTGGLLYHHTTSPRLDKRGTTADALDGTIRKDADRTVNTLSIFFENLFRWGPLSVTPGLRLENIWQDLKENQNLDKTTVPLADESESDFVPLAGVAAAYKLSQEVEAYGNFSQAYRPKIFTQAVPTGTNQVVNEDLKEGKAWQADAGLRGSPFPFLTWDAGCFYLEFEDQIGSATINGLSSVQNVGDARHRGVELFAEFDLIGFADHVSGSRNAEKAGNLGVFYSAMFLDAEFTGGPNTGKIPQYAPDFIQKGGMEYRLKERAKVRLAGTFTDDHFADDNNTAQRIVPSYKVWDLTAEFKAYKDLGTLFGGVNNLFNEHYFARVRSDGIDPADGRNYYGGIKFVW